MAGMRLDMLKGADGSVFMDPCGRVAVRAGGSFAIDTPTGTATISKGGRRFLPGLKVGASAPKNDDNA